MILSIIFYNKSVCTYFELNQQIYQHLLASYPPLIPMNSHYQQSKSFQPAQSDSTITPDQIYQTLIRQTPNLYPLCKFKTKGTTKPLFPDAVKYPDFFNYNLVSPGRVIKKLEGAESIVKGFYYQLMKLAFEIEIEEMDYIQVMRSVIFSPEFMLEENPSSPSSGKNYSDLQYKKIVAEFMQILMHQSIPNFQLTLLSYPIVDQAMVKILQNLLKFKGSVEIPLNASVSSFEILTLLAELFQITVNQYGSCFKFQQSDIFFYEHSRNEYYIAFLNQMAQMSDMSESSRRQDSSSYEPASSKKIIRFDEPQDEDEYSAKKARRTHEYLNSQFDIETPTKQQTRQCSSNPPETKANSANRNDKHYRNTIGSHQVKINEDKTVEIPLKKSVNNQQRDKQQGINDSLGSKHNRQSIINELNHLVYQTQQSQNHGGSSRFANEYDPNKKVQIPHVPLAKSIAQPTQALYEYELSNKNYPIQSQKTIKELVKYQYQPKGYGKRVPPDESSKLLAKSAQSDQVIGYSDFGIGSLKGLLNYNHNPTVQSITSNNTLSINILSNNYLSKPIQSNFNKPTESSLYQPIESKLNKPIESKLIKPIEGKLNKPIESNLNIQLQAKQYTVNKPKEIQQLGVIGHGKNYTFGPDAFQQKYNSLGLNSKTTAKPENPITPKYNQQLPFTTNYNYKSTFQPTIALKKPQSKQDIFYAPKPVISKPSFIQQTNIYKSPSKNQESLGTLYKQFSDTKVLNIMPEQMQNNIRKMRRKYKGVHSKDFFGLNRF